MENINCSDFKDSDILLLKVSKSQKQNTKFSRTPKNCILHFFALAYKISLAFWSMGSHEKLLLRLTDLCLLCKIGLLPFFLYWLILQALQ